MFDRLKNIFRGKTAAPTQPQSRAGSVPASAPAPVAPISVEQPKADKGKGTAKVAVPTPKKSPEELCGISPKMSKDEVRQKLAVLYRRYNRATSSLDAKLRAEAEEMLDAIVAIREKVFGPI
jgi:hypothetical protein